MKKKLLGCLIFLLLCSVPIMAGGLSDNFDIPRNYLVEGVGGTIWDGFIGKGPYESVDVMDASITSPGVLRIESTNGAWWEPFPPNGTLGPLLYKVVEGDFVATVYIAGYEGDPDNAIYWNVGGLMARVGNLDLAGPSEDYVAVLYCPPDGIGIEVDVEDNGVWTWWTDDGSGWNADKWLQLERKGNDFYVRSSANGSNWTTLSDMPISRPDMEGIPLQVGIFQTTYNGGSGYVEFDNFTLDLAVGKTIGTPVVKEQGETTGSIQLVLTDMGAIPTADIIVNAVPYSGGEPNDITVVNGLLTFNPDNWQDPRTVTVVAIDDDIEEGPEQVELRFTVISADQRYDSGTILPAIIRVVDNDAPDLDLTLSDNRIVVIEGIDTDLVGIALSIPPTPQSATVTVEVSNPQGQILFSPSQISFNLSNYSTTQTIEVIASDDTTLEWDPHSTMMNFTVSSTGNYNKLLVPGISVEIGENECGAWGYIELDKNRNCYLDIEDMLEFAREWLTCTIPYEQECLDLR
jgi:regulation of enolase protein 1 (concanavalin A-like superfamily)